VQKILTTFQKSCLAQPFLKVALAPPFTPIFISNADFEMKSNNK